MEPDPFKVVIPHLNDGKTVTLAFQADPAFMGVAEAHLQFAHPVLVEGEVYLANDELILHLTASTKALLHCSVCNLQVTVGVKSRGFYHTVPLAEIKGNEYDFREAVREQLLLETPEYIECNGGSCPEREAIGHYLRKEGSSDEECGQQPFANL